MEFLSIFVLNAVNIRPEILRFLCGTLKLKGGGSRAVGGPPQPPHAAKAMGAEDNVNFLSDA